MVKLLQGAGSQSLHAELKRHFQKVHWVQPKATRQESREMYIVGIRRRRPHRREDPAVAPDDCMPVDVEEDVHVRHG